MRLINHQQRIFRQIIKQCGWRLARRTTRQIARVVFNAVAVTQLNNHLDVVLRALLKALELHMFFQVAKLCQAIAQLFFNIINTRQHRIARRDVMAFRKNRHARQLAQYLSRQRIKRSDIFHFFIKQRDADSFHIRIGGIHINHITATAIGRALKINIVAAILQFRQFAQQFALIYALAATEMQHHTEILFRITQAVNRRHRGNHNNVRSLQQRFGCRQTHLFDMLIYRCIFFDKRI